MWIQPSKLLTLRDEAGICPWKHKLILFGTFLIAYSIFYVQPNLHPFFEPKYLPMLSIDRTIPFLPWTFLTYISDYLLILATIILLDDIERFNTWARLAFGTLVVSGLCFYLYPTTYPRPFYPNQQNPLVMLAINFIGSADMPTNCLPSLHVAITSAAVWSVRSYGKTVRLGFTVWGMAIIVSTLTTKQHYFVDVMGGLLVTFIVVYLEKFIFPKRPVLSIDDPRFQREFSA